MCFIRYIRKRKHNNQIQRPKGGPKTALSFNPPGHMHIFILWPWALCTTCRAARPRPLCFVQRNGTAARHGHLRRILDFYRFCWCWSTQSRTLRYDRYFFVLFEDPRRCVGLSRQVHWLVKHRQFRGGRTTTWTRTTRLRVKAKQFLLAGRRPDFLL